MAVIRLPLTGGESELADVFDAAVARMLATAWTLDNVNGTGLERSAVLSCAHGTRLSLEIVVTSPGLSGGSELIAMVAGACSCVDEVVDDIKATPFTQSEMKAVRLQMPLTSTAAGWLDVYGQRPLEGVGAVFTIHHQRDFVVMLESAIQLGLDPRDVLVIDKEYEYRHRDRVDGHIRRVLGAEVGRYSAMGEALAAFEGHMRARWRRAVLVDDGGYLFPHIRKTNPDYLQYVLGIVEQTASGIERVREFLPDLTVPLFNVAESDLKLTVEARGVAAAGLKSFREVLPDVHWSGRRAMVAGYGRIGRALAHELARESVRVAVHDTKYDRLVSAQEDGFAAYDDLSEGVSEWAPHVFFGATGRAAFGAALTEQLRQDCILVSLTSRDFEFDKAHLSAASAEIVAVPGVGTRYSLQTPAGSRNILLVADGFPINFYRAESMPNEQSDLILASMLLGTVEIVRNGDNGDRLLQDLNRDLSNDIINEHGILRRYYQLRRESPQTS